MNLSGISKKTALGKFLRFFLRVLPRGTRVPILQGKLRGKRWIIGSGENGCWLGSYEYAKQLLFSQTIRQGDVVFDVGANVGIYTLLSSVLVGERGSVFSFEPDPRNLFYLKEHVRINSMKNVTVVEAAVTDSSGAARFQRNLGSPATGHLSPVGDVNVKTISLDGFVFEQGFPGPNCIKIDVEGAEELVLRGAGNILRKYHPVLFVAFHSTHLRDTCCEFLRSLRYHCEPVGGGSFEESYETFARYEA